MKNYLVRIRANIPYPKDFDYRIEAGTGGRALDFAWRKFRKEQGVRRRKEDVLACLLLPLGALNEGMEHIDEEEASKVAMSELTANAL